MFIKVLVGIREILSIFLSAPVHQWPRERPAGSLVKSTIDYSRGGSVKKADAGRRWEGPGEQHTEERSGPLLHAWILIESSGCSTTGPSPARWHQECDRQSGIVPFSRSLRVEPPATRRTIPMYCPSFRPARLRIICSAVIWVYDARTPYTADRSKSTLHDRTMFSPDLVGTSVNSFVHVRRIKLSNSKLRYTKLEKFFVHTRCTKGSEFFLLNE